LKNNWYNLPGTSSYENLPSHISGVGQIKILVKRENSRKFQSQKTIQAIIGNRQKRGGNCH